MNRPFQIRRLRGGAERARRVPARKAQVALGGRKPRWWRPVRGGFSTFPATAGRRGSLSPSGVRLGLAVRSAPCGPGPPSPLGRLGGLGGQQSGEPVDPVRIAAFHCVPDCRFPAAGVFARSATSARTALRSSRCCCNSRVLRLAVRLDRRERIRLFPGRRGERLLRSRVALISPSKVGPAAGNGGQVVQIPGHLVGIVAVEGDLDGTGVPRRYW